MNKFIARCRKDHVESEKVSRQNWETNWKFMASNLKDVGVVLYVSIQ